MAILLSKEDQQLELLLEENPYRENQDVIDKILAARNGDQPSYEDVYTKYKPILTSRYVERMINFTANKDTKDDYLSILNVLFVESVNTYDPTKSKFSTYLINRIKFKFYVKYIKERLINVPSGLKSAIVKDLIQQTVCSPIGMSNTFDTVMNPVIDRETVSVKIGDDIIDIDKKLFIEQMLLVNITSVLPKDYIMIYRTYIKNHLKDERTAINKTAKRYKLTVQYIYSIVKKCNRIMQEKIQLV